METPSNGPQLQAVLLSVQFVAVPSSEPACTHCYRSETILTCIALVFSISLATVIVTGLGGTFITGRIFTVDVIMFVLRRLLSLLLLLL